MKKWLYYGSNELQSDGETVTLPPDLFHNRVLPKKPETNVFWFVEDGKVGISDSLVSNSQIPDFVTNVQVGAGSRSTTIVKPCRVDKDGDSRFEPKQVLHFVATKEMVDGEESSVYVLTTDQLLETVPSSEAWLRTKKNIQRLFDLAEIDRLEKLLADELTGRETRTGHGKTVSFDSYRYHPGKGGFVEIGTDSQGVLAARWFRYDDRMNSLESESETYSLIESEFGILDPEDKTLEQIGETQQFTVEYYKGVDDWAKESEDGTLDHLPRAIENALEDGGWTVEAE